MENYDSTNDNSAKVIQSDINNVVCELKHIKNTDRAYELLVFLDTIKNLVDEASLQVEYPKELSFEKSKFDLYSIYKYFHEYYTNEVYRKMISYSMKLPRISKLLKNSFNNQTMYLLDNKLSHYECAELVYDFYSEYDEKMSKLFKTMINEDRVVFANISEYGYHIMPTYVTDSYIAIYPVYTVSEANTMAHEIAHAYIEKLNNIRNKEEYAHEKCNCLSEVFPCFIELLFNKYISDRNLYKEDIRKIVTCSIVDLINNIEQFKEEKYISIESGFSIYGRILAHHFYNQYLINPKQAKENIMNFMIESKNHDIKYMLNNYGLNIDDVFNAKKLKRYIKRYIERL